ncbi:MAG: Holliday junction resolvase RuvX [Chloroflexi bacterium]|nr:Holliday junction resolvase RuvX [Chloroflexota bacterium]
MALDLGEKRIGIAVSNPEGTLAFPDRVLVRRTPKRDRATLASVARELQAERIVLGLPLTMDGEAGPNAERARRFGEFLTEVLDVPLEYQDERLTTIEAEERLRARGLSGPERRQHVDALAAAIILEDYIRARGR